MRFEILLTGCLVFFAECSGVLVDVRNFEESLVLVPLENSFPSLRNKRDVSANLELLFFRIQADIRYRYSRTYVTSHVINRDSKNAKEVSFQVVLPETAFISKFSMEIDGKTYEAYVKEKDEAKRVYHQAQSQGQSAGLVAINTRHSNVFNVNVNIKANSIINFNLTYEELLARRLGRYEQSININGDQISNVKDVEVQIAIEESQPLTLVRVPDLRNDLEVQKESETDNKDAVIEKPTANRAKITWRPSPKDPKLSNGKMGQFIVQYDIQRESDSGEVLIMNGYFVHFFAPPNLKPLRKHVVFVLDISGSMSGRKIEQLKAAMGKILSDLGTNDYLNIIIFSTDVVPWAPGDHFEPVYREGRSFSVSSKSRQRQPFPATAENIEKAKQFIESLQATGGTNIHDALIEALDLISSIRKTRDEHHGDKMKKLEEDEGRSKRSAVKVETTVEVLPPFVESLIIFLTDGEPTVGVTDPTQIQERIQAANVKLSVPIFSLAFGQGADFPFIRKLSLQNNGLGRKIYEAADAVLQLQGFYNEIASPLLSNVKFNYTSPESKYTVHEITRKKFPVLCDGSEIAVAGRIDSKASIPPDSKPATVSKNAVMFEHQPLVKYVPTDRCYFHTHIRGYGHDGEVQWHRPMMHIWRPPWWCPPFPALPTTTTTKKPLPETSLEDTFLERLWAYLTIQQLLEKDLIQDKSSSDSSKESPKQRALGLALKYGFVTPLTSLVVVKPASKDVTDTRPADARPEQDGPAGVNHYNRHYKSSGGLSASSGMMPSFASTKRVGGFHHMEMLPPPLTPSMDMQDSGMAASDTEASTNSKSSNSGPISATTERSTSTSTTVPSATPKSSKKLKLMDVKWLKNSRVTIKRKDYVVAREDEMIDPGMEQDCNIGSGGSPLNRTKGQCRHLKDCVQTEFAADFGVYETSYFCPIEIKGDSFAGVCCAERRSSRVGT